MLGELCIFRSLVVKLSLGSGLPGFKATWVLVPGLCVTWLFDAYVGLCLAGFWCTGVVFIGGFQLAGLMATGVCVHRGFACWWLLASRLAGLVSLWCCSAGVQC